MRKQLERGWTWKHRPGGVVNIELVHRGGMDEDMRRLVIVTGVVDVDGAEQDRV